MRVQGWQTLWTFNVTNFMLMCLRTSFPYSFHAEIKVAMSRKFTRGVGLVEKTLGNSADKLRHTTSVAYSVVLVLLNKHQISYLHYYQTLFHPRVTSPTVPIKVSAALHLVFRSYAIICIIIIIIIIIIRWFILHKLNKAANAHSVDSSE